MQAGSVGELKCRGRIYLLSVATVRPASRAESRFPNPTVRAGSASRTGSAGGLKRGTVPSDGRTHALTT